MNNKSNGFYWDSLCKILGSRMVLEIFSFSAFSSAAALPAIFFVRKRSGVFVINFICISAADLKTARWACGWIGRNEGVSQRRRDRKEGKKTGVDEGRPGGRREGRWQEKRVREMDGKTEGKGKPERFFFFRTVSLRNFRLMEKHSINDIFSLS